MLLEVRAVGLAARRGVRRGDALADGQGGLALGQLALAPGEPGLALGEDHLRLLLQRRLLALEPLLGLAQRREPILHRTPEAAGGVCISGRLAVAHLAHTSSRSGSGAEGRNPASAGRSAGRRRVLRLYRRARSLA
jgi:hypothetical protein